MGVYFSLKGLQQSITLASIVFTLSVCLNLVAGKNLPYKGSPSEGNNKLVEVEDTEDNNGERGTYKFRTKRHLSIGGGINGGFLNNGQDATVDIGHNVKCTKLYGNLAGITYGGKRYENCQRRITVYILLF